MFINCERCKYSAYTRWYPIPIKISCVGWQRLLMMIRCLPVAVHKLVYQFIEKLCFHYSWRSNRRNASQRWTLNDYIKWLRESLVDIRHQVQRTVSAHFVFLSFFFFPLFFQHSTFIYLLWVYNRRSVLYPNYLQLFNLCAHVKCTH